MEKLSITLDGMGCGGCVNKVRKALNALDGVTVENVALGWAVLAYDPARSSQQVVAEALAKAGFLVRENGAATAGAGMKGGDCGIPS